MRFPTSAVEFRISLHIILFRGGIQEHFSQQRWTTRVVNKEWKPATVTGHRERQQCPLPAVNIMTPWGWVRGSECRRWAELHLHWHSSIDSSESDLHHTRSRGSHQSAKLYHDNSLQQSQQRACQNPSSFHPRLSIARLVMPGCS